MPAARENRIPGRLAGEVVSVLVVATLALLVTYALEFLFDLDRWNGEGLEGLGAIVVLVLLLPLKVPVANLVKAKLRQRRSRG